MDAEATRISVYLPTRVLTLDSSGRKLDIASCSQPADVTILLSLAFFIILNMASGAYLQSRKPSAPFRILDMNVIPQGPAVSPQLGNNGRRSTTLKKANHIPNATNTFTDNQTKNLPPQREGSSAGQREKLSLVCLFPMHE